MGDIIDDNYKGENESFMYYLHEKAIFKENLLMELIFEIIDISKELSLKDILKHRKYLTKLFKIYGDFTSHIISNFNKNDVYKIKNPSPELYIYISRLTFIFDKFIYLDYKAMEKYEDELGSLRKE